MKGADTKVELSDSPEIPHAGGGKPSEIPGCHAPTSQHITQKNVVLDLVGQRHSAQLGFKLFLQKISHTDSAKRLKGDNVIFPFTDQLGHLPFARGVKVLEPPFSLPVDAAIEHEADELHATFFTSSLQGRDVEGGC